MYVQPAVCLDSGFASIEPVTSPVLIRAIHKTNGGSIIKPTRAGLCHTRCDERGYLEHSVYGLFCMAESRRLGSICLYFDTEKAHLARTRFAASIRVSVNTRRRRLPRFLRLPAHLGRLGGPGRRRA